MTGEAEAPPVVVTLGTEGLRAFLKAFADAGDEAEVTLTVGMSGGAWFMLAEVNCIGTFLPMAEVENFARHLREYPWGTHGKDMCRLAEMMQAASDTWHAKQGPRH